MFALTAVAHQMKLRPLGTSEQDRALVADKHSQSLASSEVVPCPPAAPIPQITTHYLRTMPPTPQHTAHDSLHAP
jgi:hypothetical protein